MHTKDPFVRDWPSRTLVVVAAVLTVGALVTLFDLHKISFGGGQGCRDSCCGSESYEARASQITTMVTRFNQFRPGGAEPIELVACAIYTPEDLAALVTAGYCANTDLINPHGGNWVWNGTTRKFEPEER